MTGTAHRGRNRQLAINFISTIVSYVVNFGIAFFLTPYIVGELGASSYGFIGLANNIISYTALLTVALNSMSSRYITLNFHSGDINEANRYVSSTFFANVGMSFILTLVFGTLIVFLEFLINIPSELLSDVRILFALLCLNSVIGLAAGGVFNVAPFIRNRLEIINIVGLGSNLLRAMLIVAMFGFFPPKLWYVGATAIACTLYSNICAYHYFKKLTPELRISKSEFTILRVREMIKAGAWNLLSQLSAILNQGLELLLANIFISAYYMGILSISKAIPWIILGVFASLANIFQPEYIKYYAEKKFSELRLTLLKSLRIMGVVAAIPCAIILAYGDMFFSVWMPHQDAGLLYILTFITMFGISFTLPTQSLWYIFVITNTVRQSAIVNLLYGLANVALVIAAMLIVKSDLLKAYIIVGIQAGLYVIRSITFLPFYGAKVLGFSKYSLLGPSTKIISSILLLSLCSYLYKISCVNSYTWTTFIGACVVTTLFGGALCYRLFLTSSDRAYIKTKLIYRK